MQTFERVCDIISCQLGLDAGFDFSADTTWEELDADSLDLVEIVMAIEEEFEVEIPEENEEKLNTLADIADWLGEHMSEEDLEAYSEMCQDREEDDDEY